jgi:hypothetical protein
MDEVEFRIRKIFGQVSFAKGLNIPTHLLDVDCTAIKNTFNLMLHVATVESEIHDTPMNNLVRAGYWWHSFKKRHKWLQRMFKLCSVAVWMIAKYPEVSIPKELLGAEFIHFREIKIPY